MIAAMAALMVLVGCEEPVGPDSFAVSDVGPVHMKKERPWYHKQTSYAKGLTDEQVQQEVAKIMCNFTMAEERWEECLTYQDYLLKGTERPARMPEVDFMAKIRNQVENYFVSGNLQGPPVFLREVKVPGLRYSGRVKRWDKLTRKEMLLLKRYYLFHVLPEDELKYWENDLLLTAFSALIHNWWTHNRELTTSRPEQLFTDVFDMRYLLNPRKGLKGDEWNLWVQRWLYEYTSPITNRIFEPWHKEFSAGNGYFQLVTDSQVVDHLWEYLSEHDQTAYPRADTYFMYYRVYGERKVIAEGFYAGYVGTEPVKED